MSATVGPQVVLVEQADTDDAHPSHALRSGWVAMLSAYLANEPRTGSNAVAFDVLTTGWRFAEMQDKFAFYEKYGAEEYYILYPEFPMFAEAFRREGEKPVAVADVNGYVSPRTGLRFALETGHLTVFGRDNKPLRTAEEQVAEREAAEREAEQQRQKAAALAARLRELGVDPDTV